MRNRLLLRHFIAVGGNSAWEVGDMGVDITGWVRRRTWGKEKN